MTRTILPTRRQNETTSIQFGAKTLTVTVGFDRVGSAKEIFCSGPKDGSEMQHILADACVIISIALQHGIAPDALARSLGRVPTWRGEEWASPIGAILEAVQ